jgi:uncharacterized protein (UPF0335 family)
MAQQLDLTADIIDVRDIIERVEELESEIEAYAESMDDWQANADNQQELEALMSIMEEMKGYGGDEQWRGDWYPVTLIRDSHFEEAMDELVHDCYDMPKNLPDFMTITLDYVALQMDYTSVEIEGATYWYR